MFASGEAMMKHALTTTLVVIATFGAAACDDNTGNRDTSAASNAAADQRNGTEDAPITLTGCLQKQDRTFIVTRINQPSQSNVGTTGGAALDQERLRVAANAYRVEGQNGVDLDSLVGKQVRVTGKIEERADLMARAGQPTGTSGTDADRGQQNGRDIDSGDLAKVEATSVSAIADNCGTAPAAGGASSPSSSTPKNPAPYTR
jgi:hypothetical protein